MKEKQLTPESIELCKKYFKKGSVLEVPDKKEKGMLRDLPDEYRVYEVCVEAIKANPQNLFAVPKRHLTKEIYTIAVREEPSLAYLVPKSKLTEEICIIALEKLNIKLSWVPKHLRTNAVCQAGIAKSREALKIVPGKAKDFSLCLNAVKFDGANLKYVPHKIMNDQICVEAINQHPQASQFIPEGKMSYAVYKSLVEKKLIKLSSVPYEYRDVEMCIMALSVCEETRESVPHFPLDVLYSEKLQALLADKLNDEAEKFRTEKKKHETVAQMIAKSQPKPAPSAEPTKTQPSEFADAAYIDFLPYL